MHSVVRFYRKIYDQEMSQVKMLHLDSNRIAKYFVIDGVEELGTAEYPKIPISDKAGEELSKLLALRSGEIELKYFLFCRFSSFISLNKYESKRLYPLIEFDATIEYSQEAWFISIDLNSRKVIKKNLPAKIIRSEEMAKALLSEVTDFHFASKMHDAIAQHFPDADADGLLEFPSLWSSKGLKKELKKKFKVGDKYIPIATVAAIEIENNSYTTLDELEKLEIRESLSAPLEVLLNGLKNERKEKRGIICEELNASQMEAVDNGNERVISVISGPPGTGKSFTIANLAAEKVSKGQSVLITSKNKEALDVIEDKIRSNIGIENLCVNPTKDATFWELRDYLEDILGRNYKRSNLQFRDVENRFHDLDEFMEEHKALEYRLKSSFEGERTIVDVLNNRKSTARSSLIFKERVLKSRSKIGVPLWESLQEYYKSIETYKEKTLSILQSIIRYKIDENVINKRADLRNYHSFLRSAAVTSQAKEYKESLEAKVDYNVVVDTFPVWLVKANEVSKIIPLEKEIFDVLIIDEASQCDIPSVLPLIHRAKKCIVVGDSKQLNHVSFITNSFESAARRDVVEDKRHLCGHRNRSVLNLAEETLDPMEVTQLNEHFRSQFPLIAFSNSEFYNSELNILTKRPISTNRHIEFIQTAGKRSKGYNQVEVDLLIANVRKRIEDEEKLPEHLKSTIGILSPFRKQVDRIFSVLKKEFKLEEIQAHKILVGTAFTFQGNERDEMHLTLALDNGSVGGSFTFLNRADVFNVSVTRARNVQYIYHSFDREVLKDNTTISNFFSFYAKEMDDLKGKDLKDAFCDDVEDFFKEKGCDCWRAFEISGVSIDLLVKNGDDFVGIDLIGFPGEMQDYYSLERYKMIERGKIKLFPMAYSMWKGNKEKCKAALEQLIEPKSEI